MDAGAPRLRTRRRHGDEAAAAPGQIYCSCHEITGAGVETTTRIIRTQRAMFTEAALRASIVSKHRLGEEATLQVMQSVNASWSGMRALKKIFNHFGIVLKQK